MDDVPDEPDLFNTSSDESEDENADKVKGDEENGDAENDDSEDDDAEVFVKRMITNNKTASRHFQKGEYAQAEALYTKAINADVASPLLYTNRAMARLKLALHEGVIDDCGQSLKLLPHNMKAHYYRAQALLALERPAEATGAAKEAYELAYLSGDRAWERSLGNIIALVLKSKKAVWEEKERRRLKTQNRVRDEVIAAVKREMERQLETVEDDRVAEDVRRECEENIEEVMRVWDKASEGEDKKREVPDWMIDDITFAIMVDPVIVSFAMSP